MASVAGSSAPVVPKGAVQGVAPLRAEITLLQDLGVVPFMLGARSCFATCA